MFHAKTPLPFLLFMPFIAIKAVAMVLIFPPHVQKFTNTYADVCTLCKLFISSSQLVIINCTSKFLNGLSGFILDIFFLLIRCNNKCFTDDSPVKPPRNFLIVFNMINLLRKINVIHMRQLTWGWENIH